MNNYEKYGEFYEWLLDIVHDEDSPFKQKPNATETNSPYATDDMIVIHESKPIAGELTTS